MSRDEELAVALEAVARAAHLCATLQPRVHAGGGELAKADQSPVTIADLGSQALICELLAARLPNDLIVGEEDAGALRDPLNYELLERVVGAVGVARGEPIPPEDVLDWIDRGAHRGQPRRYWTLDPIDGTKGFLRGDAYAVALALIEDGEVVLGVLGCPTLPAHPERAHEVHGALFHAVRGRGAFVRPLAGPPGEDLPLAVSGRERLADLRLCESLESGHTSQDGSARIAASLGIGAAPRRLDSMAKYALVARGEAELYLRLPRRGYQENVWDHAAGALLVTEAGGQVTDVDGAPLAFGSPPKLANARGIVASHGRHHARVLEAVRAELANQAVSG